MKKKPATIFGKDKMFAPVCQMHLRNLLHTYKKVHRTPIMPKHSEEFRGFKEAVSTVLLPSLLKMIEAGAFKDLPETV